MARTIQEAVRIADVRLRSATGTPEDEPAALRAEAQELAVLFVGMPVDARECIVYAGDITHDTMRLVMAGNSPVELTFGLVMRTLLIGMLVAEGGPEE